MPKATDANHRSKLILMDERPEGWNRTYSGQHWSKRKAEADRVHLTIRAAIDLDTAKLYTVPVHIIITVYFSTRPLDPDNINAKHYIDGLKGLLLQDDTRKWVASVTTESHIDKARPRVEIEMIPLF